MFLEHSYSMFPCSISPIMHESSLSTPSSFDSVSLADDRIGCFFRKNSRQKAINLLFEDPSCFFAFPPEYQEQVEMRKTAFLSARVFGKYEICQRLLASEGVGGPLVSFDGLLSRNWVCFANLPINCSNVMRSEEAFKAEKVVAEFLVRQDGVVLQHLPLAFQDDMELVWNATQNNVRAFLFCSARLRRYFFCSGSQF